MINTIEKGARENKWRMSKMKEGPNTERVVGVLHEGSNREKNQLKFLHASHLTLIRYIQSSTNSYIFFSSFSIRIKGITQSSSKPTTICSQMYITADKGNINIKYSYGLQLGLSNLYYNRWIRKRQRVVTREREKRWI